MTPQEIEALKRDVLEAQGLSLTDVLSTGDTLKKYAVLEAIDHLIAQGWGPQSVSTWPTKDQIGRTVKQYARYVVEFGEPTPERIEAAMWALHDVLKAVTAPTPEAKDD